MSKTYPDMAYSFHHNLVESRLRFSFHQSSAVLQHFFETQIQFKVVLILIKKQYKLDLVISIQIFLPFFNNVQESNFGSISVDFSQSSYSESSLQSKELTMVHLISSLHFVVAASNPVTVS